MKKNFLIIIIFILAATGCTDGSSGSNGNNGSGREGDEKKFWAYNYITESFYQLDAQLLVENARCEVWVEKTSGVDKATAQLIANAYSNNIYNKMISTFSSSFVFKGKIFSNVMDLAHYIATGESYGKLTILLLDIKDSYQIGVKDSYVAGYFLTVDFLDQLTANSIDKSPKTNQRDMIYIDTNPGLSNINRINEVYGTLAHEMQHLMNFTTSLVFRDHAMDVWINEGLSSAAEWVVYREHPQDKLINYNKDIGLISEGNNFFVWGNREGNGPGESQYAVLADYATVYLFFQWLRLQSNGTDIYRDIIKSSKYNQDAVTEALNSIVGGYASWDKVLGNWLAANYIHSSSGEYGYKNDSMLNGLKRHHAPTVSQNINLYPGEGVYSYVSSTSTIPTPLINIKYAGLTSTVVPSGSSIGNGNALLTYNVSTNIKNNAETGFVTGTVPSPSIDIAKSVFGSDQDSTFTKPFPIGMNDELRRKGREIDFYKIDFNLLKKIVDE